MYMYQKCTRFGRFGIGLVGLVFIVTHYIYQWHMWYVMLWWYSLCFWVGKVKMTTVGAVVWDFHGLSKGHKSCNKKAIDKDEKTGGHSGTMAFYWVFRTSNDRCSLKTDVRHIYLKEYWFFKCYKRIHIINLSHIYNT